MTGGFLFAVSNWDHKILKFQINEGLKLVKTIGRSGEGPGDLSFPVRISIWDGEIAVRSNRKISFFDLNGNFLRNFRIFHGGINFVYVKDKIYYVFSPPESEYLIEVYNKEGKKISQFGKKFIKINFSLFVGLNPFNVENFVYSGYSGTTIVTDGVYIYYLNPKFGNFIKFKLDGEKVMEKSIGLYFGKKGEEILKENKKMWIKEGIDLRKTNNELKDYNLFKDVYICGKNLYLLQENQTLKEKFEEEVVNILTFDKDSLKFSKTYKIKKTKDESFISLAVSEREGKLIFYLSKISEKDYIIAEYIEEK